MSDDDEEYQPKMKKQRFSRIKKQFINESICSALDRYKISDRAAVHVIIPIIEALEFDANDFTINRTSLQQTRSINRAKSAKKIKDHFKAGFLLQIIQTFNV